MSGAKRPAEGNEYYAGRECKTCERDWLCQGNPEHPAPGVRVPLAGPCVGNKSGKKQNNQDWVTPRCTNWCRMADLAMKTSGATKAAVRTVEPLTDYTTHIRKTSTWFTGHVDSTDN